MFISVFNYLCLKDCDSPESQWCWNESRLAKLLVFCLQGRIFDQSFFVGVSFVSFYKQAKSVSQQMRNCVCKTQTATTGRQPVTISFLDNEQDLSPDRITRLSALLIGFNYKM